MRGLIGLGWRTLTTTARKVKSMSILLSGVGTDHVRLATNDLTHGFRRQAARRAQKQAPL